MVDMVACEICDGLFLTGTGQARCPACRDRVLGEDAIDFIEPAEADAAARLAWNLPPAVGRQKVHSETVDANGPDSVPGPVLVPNVRELKGLPYHYFVKDAGIPPVNRPGIVRAEDLNGPSGPPDAHPVCLPVSAELYAAGLAEPLDQLYARIDGFLRAERESQKRHTVALDRLTLGQAYRLTGCVNADEVWRTLPIYGLLSRVGVMAVHWPSGTAMVTSIFQAPRRHPCAGAILCEVSTRWHSWNELVNAQTGRWEPTVPRLFEPVPFRGTVFPEGE